METLSFHRKVPRAAGGTAQLTIVGVVASGNVEVLVERVLPPDEAAVEITTPVTGFGAVWEAVIGDFIDRHSPGGLRLSLNDGGARPDTVMLRLAQGLRSLETGR